MKSQRFLATTVLVVLAAAPLAFAQGTKPKKKGAKPAASASASAPPTDTAPPPPPPPPAPTPEPSAEPEPEPKKPPVEAAGAGEVIPGSPQDTAEEPGKRYYFVGARYRGNLIPQFLENMFVNDGATFFSNSVAIELDMRTDGHSTIPWLGYANYDTGDVLFYEKGKPDDPTNYSDVKSRLGAIYVGLDELWSTPLDEAHHWDFEYGFGVGIGVLFGTLYNDWVYLDPNGSLAGTNGNHYTQCSSTTLPAGIDPTKQGQSTNPCDPKNHNNATDNKVGGYQEKNWFNGGSVPVIFPHIAIPQLSIRYKPVKTFEARFGLGFSITGFWFGISGDYGLEKPKEEEKPDPTKHGRVTPGSFVF
jgi:hypothetical protein